MVFHIGLPINGICNIPVLFTGFLPCVSKVFVVVGQMSNPIKIKPLNKLKFLEIVLV